MMQAQRCFKKDADNYVLEEHAASIFKVEVHGQAARKVVTQFNGRGRGDEACLGQ
jgi:hypothetical protein